MDNLPIVKDNVGAVLFISYVNIIAVKEGNENNEGIVALVEALKSDEIKEFINNTYNGGVIPFE